MWVWESVVTKWLYKYHFSIEKWMSCHVNLDQNISNTTQKCLDEITQIPSRLTKVMG